jgi:flagellar biosynthesis/type III secretory pathway protein FliH
LFHLENSQAPEELLAMVKTLNQWLYAPEQASLRRAFTVWLKKVLLPARLPDVEMPDLSDLNEVNTMLAERVKEWTQQWKAEGMQEGLEKGIEKGREEGRKTGEATMLCKMLELKYGLLPAWAQEKITQADAATLEQWATRLFNAQTLDEVFNSET